MIDCGELISLSDDDCTAMYIPQVHTIGSRVHRKRKKRPKKPEYIETIVIDEESFPQSSQNSVIEVCNTEDSADKNKNAISSQMNELFQENKLLTMLIEECLNIDNSADMADVLNNNIIKTYRELDREYKESKEFQKVLNKALKRLTIDPDYKFTYLNNLWETMLFHRKKRVELVTLATNLKDGKHLKRSAEFSPKRRKKYKRIKMVESDEEENVSLVINLDDDFDHDVVLLEQTIQVDDEKENVSSENIIIENPVQFIEINKSSEDIECGKQKEQNNNTQDVIVDPDLRDQIKNKTTINVVDRSSTIDQEKANQCFPNNNSEETGFLVPITEVYCDPNSTQNTSEPVSDEQLETPLDMAAIKQIEKQIASYKGLIKKLEQEEVDDDSMTSPYIQCEKYKEKIVNLYKQLCQLTGQAPVKHKSVRLTVLEGQPPGPVRRLEEFINSKIGSDGNPPFPDFYDVVKCVRKANSEDGLGWSNTRIIKEAGAIFTHCGRALQKRRQQRLYRDLASLLDEATADPAEEDPALLARLEENRRLAAEKEKEILEKFTRLQDVPRPPGPSSSIENAPSLTKEDSEGSDTEGSDFDYNASEIISEVTEKKSDISDCVNNNAHVKVEKPSGDQIKEESTIDISKRLEELGDNFTITIMDIQDPFLTIEISSESSSDEE